MQDDTDEFHGGDSPAGNVELAPGVFVSPVGLRLQFSRSGGPGGQNVNKVNSKAELWLRLDCIQGLDAQALQRLRALAGTRLTQAGEIHLQAQAQRSQEANRQAVFQRLREMLVQARRKPKARRRTGPTRGSREKRLQAKRRRGQIKSNRRGREEQW